MTLDEILKEIKEAEKIVILTHESPDGDAIGSALAMKALTDSLGKETDLIMPEYSRLFKFLPGIENIKTKSNIDKYDLAISVDCATLKRLAEKEHFENASRTIVIDHHGSNNMFGDLNFVNPASTACCEILAGMYQYYEIEITKDIGSCILAGIITDTGGFRHQGINPETFEFTAELIRKGVDISEIYNRVLCTKTKPNFELTKIVTDRIEILENETIAFSYMTNQDEIKTGAEPGDHEGLVDIGINIEDIQVSIFIRQQNTENAYKVSMRSKNDINVSDICLMFGGGGHPRAAGCLINGTVEEVKEKILTETKKALR